MTKFALPSGWSIFKFGEIAESITERVDDPKDAGVDIYVGLEHLDSGTTKITRFGTPDDVEAAKLRFYRGDVIYARRRAYQRKLGVAEVEGICSAHALVLRARPDVCIPEFLPYFLQSDQFHERALSISVGSLSPTINWKTLVLQEFALPPISEQLRTVKVMMYLDEVIEKFRNVPLGTFEESLISSFLGREKDEEMLQPLGDLLLQIDRREEVDGMAEVEFAGVRWYTEGVYRRPSVPAKELKTRYVNRIVEGDITYNRMWATKAAFGVVGPEVDGCLVTNDFPTFIAKDGVNPIFFGLVFKTRAFKSAASALAKGSTERKRLNEKDFLSIKVVVPKENDLENLLAAMKRIELLKTQISRNLDQLGQLRNSLLQSCWAL